MLHISAKFEVILIIQNFIIQQIDDLYSFKNIFCGTMHYLMQLNVQCNLNIVKFPCQCRISSINSEFIWYKIHTVTCLKKIIHPKSRIIVH